MPKPSEFYDLLLDYASACEPVRELVIGLVWTYCEAGAYGLAMSPGIATRTLPWSGSLRGRPVQELAAWVREFDPYQATVGMAAVNAAINRRQTLPDELALPAQGQGNLAVFRHFLPYIQRQKTVVIGRYPGLQAFIEANGLDWTVLERNPGPHDLPDTACEYLLPAAEWVFITASAIPNKTFPRLAALSRDATTVLMGPTTPWLPDLYHFGVDYLAGVVVADQQQLTATVAEGGGVRLFDGAVNYRIAALNPAAASAWARRLITQTVAEKETLTRAMSDWYGQGHSLRFPRYGELEAANRALARLDVCYQRLLGQIAP